ncbi:hypothetical protein SESBI_41210 [Sesbania bispinosa]|nr:hypothetical protein SESBI_41210 [Sesbania bispinosa]
MGSCCSHGFLDKLEGREGLQIHAQLSLLHHGITASICKARMKLAGQNLNKINQRVQQLQSGALRWWLTNAGATAATTELPIGTAIVADERWRNSGGDGASNRHCLMVADERWRNSGGGEAYCLSVAAVCFLSHGGSNSSTIVRG